MNKKNLKLIIELYNRGLKTIELGKQFSVSQSTIRYNLKKHGIKLQKSGFQKGNIFGKRNLKETDLKLVIELYQQGMSITKIKEKLNIARSTIWRNLHNADIKLRKKGFQKGDPRLKERVCWLKGKTRSLETCKRQSETRKRLFAEGKLKVRTKGKYSKKVAVKIFIKVLKKRIKQLTPKERKSYKKRHKKYYYHYLPYSIKYKNGLEKKRFTNQRYKARKIHAVGSHTLDEWEKVKKIYGYMCLCCKRTEPEIKLTEDHIIPLSMGGTDYIWNIQPLCFSCNSRKNIKEIDYRNDFTSLINNQLMLN